MKQKSDTQKQRALTWNESIAKRRLKQINEQLQARPEMLAQFEAILGIAAQSDPGAPFRTADEVEALVVDAMRRLGHQTLTQWAHEAQARAVEDCKAEHPTARLKKKARCAGGACMGKSASRKSRCAPRRSTRCGPSSGARG